MKGALILVIANVLVKVIGAAFKIPLARLLGEEGMGIFSDAYTTYTFMFIIATAGLPVAVSKMISESESFGKKEEVRKILGVSLRILGIIGVVGSVALFVGAQAFANALGNPYAAAGIRAISPAVLFVSIMSAFRGFFQGHQNMTPTAVSEVMEALGKLILGYALAYYFMKTVPGDWARMSLGAAGAMMGISIGALLALLVLIVYYLKCRRRLYVGDTSLTPPRSAREIAKKLITIAIPITIGASVFSLTSLIDMAMVKHRLMSAGFSNGDAVAMYGLYAGFAVPLFNLPPTLISSVSISVVPVISSAFAAKKTKLMQDTAAISLKVTVLFALPCAVGLSILANPILELLYNNTGATQILSILGYAVVFVSLVMVTNAILQAMGKVNLPVRNMLIGGVAKIIINFFLVGNPHINIVGAPIATNVCYILILALNLYAVVKTAGMRLKIGELVLKPLLCVAAMAAVVLTVYGLTRTMSVFLCTMLSIGAGGITYLAMLFLTKAITYADVLMLPKGETLANYMLRYHLIQK